MGTIVGMLIIGLAAGWITAQIMGAGKAGLLSMTLIGIIGSFVGGFLISLVGFEANGTIAKLISATLGAVVSVWALRKWK